MLEKDSSFKRLLNNYIEALSFSFEVKEIVADMEFYEVDLMETVEIYLIFAEEIKLLLKTNNPLLKNGFIIRKAFKMGDEFEVIATFQPIKNSI